MALENIELNITIAMLEKFNLLSFIKDKEGVYLWLSEKLLTYIGMSAAQIIGYKDNVMPWKDHAAYIASTDISCHEDAKCRLYEFNLHKLSELNFKFLWGVGSENTGVFGVCILEEVGVFNQEVADIIKAYTHDLRLPINSVLGHLQLCKYLLQQGNTSQVSSILEKANRGVIAILNTLEHFKNLAKSQTKSFMVFPMVQYEVDMAQALIGPHQSIDIYYNIGSSVPMEMSCNLYPIQQIIRNLLSNSVKFTLNGSITLRLDIKPQDYLPRTHHNSIRANNKDILIIKIHDTGAGLPEHVCKSLDLLSKCSAKNINNNSGLEIIVKHLKLMDGCIEYSATPQGSQFSCYIPIS